MLKDITLGQYFPGNTIVHRFDPRAKIIYLVFYIAALFLAKSWISYGVMALVLVVESTLSRIKPKTLFSGMKPLIFIIIFTGLINVLYGTGEPLFTIWVFTITKNGIRTAFFMVIRIIMLVCGTFLLTYTTSPLQLTDGLEALLGPLKKIKVPVHELAMMMSIALRFIPTLIEETDKIMSAQKARGASFDTGNLIQRAKALVPLLVPLFVSAFRRADELATAMECRCYHDGQGRTRMKQLTFAAKDFVLLLFSLAMLAGILVLRKFGL